MAMGVIDRLKKPASKMTREQVQDIVSFLYRLVRRLMILLWKREDDEFGERKDSAADPVAGGTGGAVAGAFPWSLIVAVATTVLGIACACAAAYYHYRRRRPVSRPRQAQPPQYVVSTRAPPTQAPPPGLLQLLDDIPEAAAVIDLFAVSIRRDLFATLIVNQRIFMQQLSHRIQAADAALDAHAPPPAAGDNLPPPALVQPPVAGFLAGAAPPPQQQQP
ncbi:Os03g0746200 [Oryza sativa Japonica Group]|uniref:Os03g0746200 protein n=1 Tax=Oryza sativa subsp. japonica TaxID=39947 RepID=A0A0N7KI15_ORYSJ|nr:Os03g0746200 [Oryza sativa Japonica Group]